MPPEHRRNARVALDCLGTVQRRDGEPFPVSISDLSLGGCYLVSPVLPQPGEQVELSFTALGREIKGSAVVRWARPGEGFGCQFMRLDLRSSQRLHAIVLYLRGEPIEDPEAVGVE